MRNHKGIAEAIAAARTVAVCCHVNPDGDTIGSGLAMRWILGGMGKEAQVFCADKVPDNLMFLPGAEDILLPDRARDAYDLMLSMDASTPERLGACWTLIRPRCAHTAQMDHHGTNPLFMEVNSVDGEAAATCVMIRDLLRFLDIPITGKVAQCLYTGISTDTGNFSFSCTNDEAFRAAADLMKADLPIADLSFLLFRQKSRAQLLLLGRAIAGMQFAGEAGDIAVMKLTRADFAACGAENEHADTIVNYGLETIGTHMAFLARENEDGTIKFSLRAVAPLRVDLVAERLGGGGHAQAAGISMKGSLDDCAEKVLKEMEASLKAQRE